MTVSYTAEVATCRGFGCFLKLLWRWRGSVYKLLWLDLFTYLSAYYALNILYQYYLNSLQKTYFEGIVIYCTQHAKHIPLSFVLGFFINLVLERWWKQYLSIPRPSGIAMLVSCHIHGEKERGRMVRRTIMRYVILSLTMVLRRIATRVKMRFPTLQHLVDAGLLTDQEHVIIANMSRRFPQHPLYWMPIVWAASIVTRARKEGLILDDYSEKTIIDELNNFRGECSILTLYAHISIPLVYTQVVTVAVYSYFIASVMANQWYQYGNVINKQQIDINFPIFAALEFLFYMGCLKVAEVLINPFGEDDDDFDVNWLIDRHLKVSYLIVDEMHHEHPELVKDQFWDEVLPAELPVGAKEIREKHPQASTANIEIPKEVLPPKKFFDRILDDILSRIPFTERSRQVSRHESAASSVIDFDAILSTSTPIDLPTAQTQPDTSIAKENEDEFEKLRLIRRKLRKERAERKIAQTIINVLLEQMVTQSMDRGDQ